MTSSSRICSDIALGFSLFNFGYILASDNSSNTPTQVNNTHRLRIILMTGVCIPEVLVVVDEIHEGVLSGHQNLVHFLDQSFVALTRWTHCLGVVNRHTL